LPKRKRRDKQPTTPVTRAPVPEAAPSAEGVAAPIAAPQVAKPVEIDPSVALFAQRHREGIEREKAQQRARQAERQRVGERERLILAKDEAVATMKRLTRSSSATPEERDAAEAAYRAATADLIAHETGERPGWAPPVPSPDEVPADIEVTGTGTDHPEDEQAEDEPAEDEPAEVEPDGDDPA